MTDLRPDVAAPPVEHQAADDGARRQDRIVARSRLVAHDAPGQRMTWSPIDGPAADADAGVDDHAPAQAGAAETEAAGCTSVANRSAARPVEARISGRRAEALVAADRVDEGVVPEPRTASRSGPRTSRPRCRSRAAGRRRGTRRRPRSARPR